MQAHPPVEAVNLVATPCEDVAASSRPPHHYAVSSDVLSQKHFKQTRAPIAARLNVQKVHKFASLSVRLKAKHNPLALRHVLLFARHVSVFRHILGHLKRKEN